MGGYSEIAAGLRSVPGSSTSIAAAISISGNAKSMRGQVESYLRNHPSGATDEQMAIDLSMKQSTQRPRRIELVEAGIVKDSGRKSRTSSKRLAVVWVYAFKTPQPV